MKSNQIIKITAKKFKAAIKSDPAWALSRKGETPEPPELRDSRLDDEPPDLWDQTAG